MRSTLGAALAVLGAVGVIAAGSHAANASSVPPTLSLKANSVTETYGKPAVVTGTLKSGSAPAAGQQVWVSTTKSSAGALAKATTTASGGFSVTLPDKSVGGTLYAGSAASAQDPASSVFPLTLKVVHPTQISSFRATLNQYWAVSVSGCVGFPATDRTGRIAHTTGLTVEYKAAGGYWNKLGVINAREADAACGTGGIKFSGTFGAKLNSADYRVVYAGTSGVTSYAAAIGSPVLLWRYDTRIAGFTLSPTAVNADGKVTIKGTLQYDNKGWHNYGRQPLVVGLLRKGSTRWAWPFVVRTNASGQFSATLKDPYSATWQVRFNGNNSAGGGHLSAWTREISVSLR